MEASRYAYELPAELIAKYPLRRGTERLLVADRSGGTIAHRRFADIVDFLRHGDVLVVNDTRVIRARLVGHRQTGGSVEVLLLQEIAPLRWRCIVKPSRRVRPGMDIAFDYGYHARVEERRPDGFIVTLSAHGMIDAVGKVPLPPYIDREPEDLDLEAYQTVYARHAGSVAAPTAGLHFTPDILEKIAAGGVEIVPVTLHVGLGTFTPLRTRDVDDHVMHAEEYTVTDAAASALNRALEAGRRVVAVGTTSARVLEHLMLHQGRITPGRGTTDLFIREGFRFRAVGALLTNFHLPCSTLLVLVCAFAGYGLAMESYRQAIENRYRFFSYGDAMLIV